MSLPALILGATGYRTMSVRAEITDDEDSLNFYVSFVYFADDDWPGVLARIAVVRDGVRADVLVTCEVTVTDTQGDADRRKFVARQLKDRENPIVRGLYRTLALSARTAAALIDYAIEMPSQPPKSYPVRDLTKSIEGPSSGDD